MLTLVLVVILAALVFEFINGFHDTANAVATVIYTHALPAPVAVVWSGLCNFLGVLLSSGAVAFGIIALLPVELILQVGSSAGFAMVFALLLAAIIWPISSRRLSGPRLVAACRAINSACSLGPRSSNSGGGVGAGQPFCRISASDGPALCGTGAR